MLKSKYFIKYSKRSKQNFLWKVISYVFIISYCVEVKYKELKFIQSKIDKSERSLYYKNFQ